MSPSRARYVTACQQLLALGVVVIALVPATRVVTLDVVGERPGGSQAGPTIAAPDAAALERSERWAPRAQARERRAQQHARQARSAERRALHRGDRPHPGLVGARHQDQRAR